MKIEEYLDRGVNPKDIAVLIRSSADSYFLETLLARKSIDYQKFGGIRFLERTFVKNIFSFLRLTTNINDEIAWFRLFQIYPNIGIVYAKKTTASILANGIDELLKPEYKKKVYSKYFEEIHEVLTKLNGMTLLEQLDFLVGTYYFPLMEKSINASKKGTSKKKDLLKELSDEKEESKVLFEFAEGYTSTLKFLTDLTLEAPTKKTEDCITISTIHSAKGLEFEVVFIINCAEGLFPRERKATSSKKEALERLKEEFEEEKRCFYVAITRARKNLYITYPRMRLEYGTGFVETNVSRFITPDMATKLEYEQFNDFYNRY